MIEVERSSSRPLAFPAVALFLALICSVWALFGGGDGYRLSWDRLLISPAGDCYTHMEFVAAAAEAQGHGWGYLREVPRVAKSPIVGYPLFQFYSFLPYHLPALAVRAGLGPYHAFIAGILLSFILGYLGMSGLARSQGLSRGTALLSAAAFSLAPYHLTDLYGRFAYAELFAFGLMPIVFWAAWALAETPTLGRWLASSLGWAALILTHSIFHLWALPLLGLWLFFAHRSPWKAPQAWAVLSAYLGGLCMALFFFGPTVIWGPKMYPTSFPMLDGLSPATVLLQPFWAPSAATLGAPLMGLQIGWLFFIPAVLLALKGPAGLRLPSWGLFIATLLLAGASAQVWSALGPLRIVQFPYRLLLFASLFGSLLLGHFTEGRVSSWALLIAVALLMLWGLSWKRAKLEGPASSAEASYQAQGVLFRTGIVYVLPPEVFTAHPEADLSQHPDPHTRVRVTHRLWYPGLYQVRLAGKDLPYGYVNGFLAVQVPPDSGPIEIRFRGIPWANGISTLANISWLLAALFWAQRRLRDQR